MSLLSVLLIGTFTPTSDGSYIFDMGANGYRFQIYNSQLYFGVSNDYVGLYIMLFQLIHGII